MFIFSYRYTYIKYHTHWYAYIIHIYISLHHDMRNWTWEVSAREKERRRAKKKIIFFHFIEFMVQHTSETDSSSDSEDSRKRGCCWSPCNSKSDLAGLGLEFTNLLLAVTSAADILFFPFPLGLYFAVVAFDVVGTLALPHTLLSSFLLSQCSTFCILYN